MLSAYIIMLVYLVFALDRLLLVKAMGHSAVLSGTSWHEQFIPSLICNNLGPSPTADTSVSNYNGAFSL